MGDANQRWDAAGAGVGVAVVGVGVGLGVEVGVGVMVGVGVGLGVQVGVGVGVGVKVEVGVAVNVAVPNTCGRLTAGAPPRASKVTNATTRAKAPALSARFGVSPSDIVLSEP